MFFRLGVKVNYSGIVIWNLWLDFWRGDAVLQNPLYPDGDHCFFGDGKVVLNLDV
jgi:hypothetical protein